MLCYAAPRHIQALRLIIVRVIKCLYVAYACMYSVLWYKMADICDTSVQNGG